MVITGSRSGLGEKLARHYAEAGFRVVGCSRSVHEATFSNYDHVQADVSQESDVKALFRRAADIGSIRVVINNAGVAAANHALLTPVDAVREVMDTTVIGCFLCCREGAKAMRRSGGSIVNLSSDHVQFATAGTAIYGAAKAAVEQFTRVFANEVASFDVRVNCLSLPYVIGIGMAARFPADGSPSAIPQVDLAAVTAALAPLIDSSAEPATTGAIARVAVSR